MSTIVHSRRRAVLGALAALLALAACSSSPIASAQETGYANRPLRLLVGFGAGTSMDTVARLIGDRLAAALGQPVVIDNRAGSSGNTANEILAHAPPDGYTLGIAGITVTILPAIQRERAVEPLRELAPITKLVSMPLLIAVNPSVPATTLGELVDLARRRRGELAYSTAGIATPPHLAAVLLSERAGIELIHVPYAAANQMAIKDVIVGEIPIAFSLLSVAEPHLRSGQLRGLAVTTLNRSSAAPEIPTVAEQGFPGYDIATWYGMFAPAGTPAVLVERLHGEFARILAMPDVRQRLTAMGMEIVGSPPREFATEVRADLARWPSLIRPSDLR